MYLPSCLVYLNTLFGLSAKQSTASSHTLYKSLVGCIDLDRLTVLLCTLQRMDTLGIVKETENRNTPVSRMFIQRKVIETRANMSKIRDRSDLNRFVILHNYVCCKSRLFYMKFISVVLKLDASLYWTLSC